MLLDALIPCNWFHVSLIVYSVIYGYVLAYIAGLSLFVFTLKGGQSFFQVVYLLEYLSRRLLHCRKFLPFTLYLIHLFIIYSQFLLEPTPSKFTGYNTGILFHRYFLIVKELEGLAIIAVPYLPLIII